MLLVDFYEPGWTYVRLETKGFEWSAAIGPGRSGCGLARRNVPGDEGKPAHLQAREGKALQLHVLATDEAGNTARAPGSVILHPEDRPLLVCTPKGLGDLAEHGGR